MTERGEQAGDAQDPREQLERAWTRTDALLDVVVDRRWDCRPLDDRPPLLAELGHTTARALALVVRDDVRRASPDPALDDLFARGGVEPGAPERPWPCAETVRDYATAGRAQVREALSPSDADTTRRAGEVLAHELLHHEVLMALLAALPGEAKRPGGPPPKRDHEAMAGARRTLHVRRDDGVLLHIDSTPVMVGEFHEFVLAGGYDEPRWWEREAWELRRLRGLRHPWRWRQVGADWLLRGVWEDLPLTRVFDVPAAVSHGEARAFLAWRQRDRPAGQRQRLPSLDELLLAGLGTRTSTRRSWPWGETPPDGERVPLGTARGGPAPVGHAAAGVSDWGLVDLIGNGWEWTDTPTEARDGGPARWVVGGSWASDPTLVARRPWLPLPPGASWLETQFRGLHEDLSR